MSQNSLMKSVFRRKDSFKVTQVLADVKKNREFNTLFSVLLELCEENVDFYWNNEILIVLSEYFPTLTALSAFQYASKLGTFILHEKSAIFSSALLQLLIESAPLMSAIKLRDWIKTGLVDIICSVCNSADDQVTTVLVTCVYYTLVMELHYLSKVDQDLINNLKSVWMKLLRAKNFEEFSTVQICSFLFYSFHGDFNEANQFAENINIHKLNDVRRNTVIKEQNVEYLFTYRYKLTKFVTSNLSALCQLFPSANKLSPIIEFLVESCEIFNNFEEFLIEFSKLTNLRYSSRAVKIQNILLKILSQFEKIRFIDDEEEGKGAESDEDINFRNGNDIHKSRKRKLRESNGMCSSLQSSDRYKDCVQLSLFDGNSLELTKIANCNETVIKIYKMSSPESKLILNRINRLYKYCLKVREHFSSSLEVNADVIAGTYIEENGNNRKKRKYNDVNKMECSQSLEHNLNGINQLLRLVAKIDSYKLPQNIVFSILLKLFKLHHLEMIKATIFLPTVFYSIQCSDSEAASELMKALRLFIEPRSDFKLKLDLNFIKLLKAEANHSDGITFKTNALRLIAILLRKHCFELSTIRVESLISLCFSFCQSVAYRLLPSKSNNDLEDEDEEEEETRQDDFNTVNYKENEVEELAHDFVLAKLDFLCAVLSKYSKNLASQSAIVMNLLPDFFRQLSFYKNVGLQSKADILEHKLSTLCWLIKIARNNFHKAIPFVMSNWLGLETRNLTFPMFHLFSACDNFDFALLSTNLRLRDKRKFALLQSQFYKLNKIIG